MFYSDFYISTVKLKITYAHTALWFLFKKCFDLALPGKFFFVLS